MYYFFMSISAFIVAMLATSIGNSPTAGAVAVVGAGLLALADALKKQK